MTIMVGSMVASRHGAREGAKSLHPGQQRDRDSMIDWASTQETETGGDICEFEASPVYKS